MKAALVGVALVLAAALAQAADGTRVYAFEVFLDDKPIGQHRFTVVTEGATRRVTSDAEFTVKFLGFNAFHYRHHAQEQWTGECLVSLSSTTDDDGKPARVRLAKVGDTNEIDTATGTRSVPGCLMTYAYWNPAMREQTRLLNPQTGEVDTVKVARVFTANVAVGGQDVPADDWRITGGASPVDVWVSAAGDWVGLDCVVAHGKHKLTYRLP